MAIDDAKILNDLGAGEAATLDYIFKQKKGIASYRDMKAITLNRRGETIVYSIEALEAKRLIKKLDDDLYQITWKARRLKIYSHPSLTFWIGVMTFAILVLTILLLCKAV